MMGALRLDPQRMVAAARRTVIRAPLQLVERAARADGGELLEQLMRTPLRRVVLETMFRQAPRHIESVELNGVTASLRCYVTGPTRSDTVVYQLDFVDGDVRVTRDPSDPDPGLTVTVEDVELLRLAMGRSNPMQAYLDGKMEISGDIMLAVRLAFLLRGARRR